MIKVIRVYTPLALDDGSRFLVERLWPRGMRKEALPLAGWVKAVAPSAALRRWFGHDPQKWEEFQCRYVTELDGNPEAWRPLLERARRDTITLLYSAWDPDHNSAEVLKRYLEAKLPRHGRRSRRAAA